MGLGSFTFCYPFNLKDVTNFVDVVFLPVPILPGWLKILHLTAVFFETGAMLTPTKSRNVTKCGSGGSFQS